MHASRIVPTSEEHVRGFRDCVDVVARERQYLLLLEAPPLPAVQQFVRNVLEGGGVHFVALGPHESVVGWCDIVRDQREGLRHTGRLGMGLLPEFRGRGVGTGLAEAAIAAAWERGMERIGLEVFASNTRAIALYGRLGFQREGLQLRARKLDGGYEDQLLMALLRPPLQEAHD